MRHRWPGNVRELENALRAASLFAEGETIELEDLIENVEDLRGAAAISSETPRHNTDSASKLALRDSSASLAVDGNDAADFPLPDGDDDSGDEISSGVNEEALPDFESAGSIAAGEQTGATTVAYACIKQGTLSLPNLKRQIERDCIARALAETRGNITRAAALLGMKRPRLSQLVKQYGLLAVVEGS
ncbi:hypothetical protein LZC95_42200 [Pendulispora brunnea]|uniref:Sigma-54 factor interaction domain-containing protein n=2 Tax=Pendulispora brunnea TaxID=2905690 RepID=A0ABZ2KQB5_9BACT